MTKQLSVEDAERQARQLLDGRIVSVRTLVKARQHLAELREQVATAERDDVRLYAAAIAGGWSTDELRKIGLAEPEKKARVRRRAAARRTQTSGTPQVATPVSERETQPAG